MPDVGVLNLQIQENSNAAIRGLDNLVGALKRIKDAVSGGLKLSPVATGLKRIGQVVDENIHGSTIVKIGQLADELSKLKGVGNVNIRISGSETVEAVRDAAKETKEALGGINTGFDDIAPRSGQMMETAEAVKELHDSIVSVANEKIDYSKLDLNKFLATPLEALTERYRQTGGAAGDFSERVSAAIPVLQEYRDMVLGLESKKDIAGFSKKTGEELVVSMKAASESAKKVTEETAKGMTVAAEKVQQAVGTTVASTEEIFERTVSAEEEYAKQFEAICESMKEKAAEADAIRKGQEEKFYAPAFSMEKTNDMADSLTKLDLLQAQLKEAEAKYNELVNSLGAKDVKSIKAGLAISDLRDKIWAYKDALQEANNEANAASGTTETLQNQFDNETSSISEATAASNEHRESLKKMADAADDAGSRIGSAGFSFKEFKKSIKSMFPLLDRLRKKLGSQIITRSIRYAIRAVTSGIKEGVENVYYYSKAINSSFAPSLDSAASSLQTMKNSLGAAAAPLIQSLIPLLQTLVNWFIEVVNWVNQFISLLRGQTTWTRAVPATTTAFEKQEKAAKKAGNAIKDLLADWDELNIIQSETNGAGTGLGSSAVEDYLNMFEEVSTFDKNARKVADFIGDHLEKTKAAVVDIGAALLAWKLSTGFTGWLSTLATIASIGFIVKLSFDSISLLDEAYAESNNIGFLIGDMAMTGALAGIAGKLAEAKFGKGAGLITAGLMFSVSAGATFYAAKNVEDESKSEMLNMLGGVKFGIAAALASAGFIKGGINPVLSIVGGVISVSLIAAITYGLEVRAEEAQKAEEMAKEAFASTGEGGAINAQDYLDALQKEFDAQTAGAKLVLKTYVEVPDLREKLTEAASQIISFNTIIFKGDGRLTEEDAKEFKKNWGIVIETLKSMDTTSYTTILQGLTAALQTKSDELRATALEIRKTFIMIEKNITAENASIYAEMEDIAGRLGTEAEKAGDLERYETLYHVFAASTETGFSEIQKALDKGKYIDFGTADTAVENATEFVKSVGEKGNAALKEVQDSLDAVTESVEYQRRIEKAKYESNLIGEEEYLSRMSAFDQILKVAKDYADEQTKAIREKMDEAYKIVLEQALSADVDSGAYWKNVMIPLIEQAKEAGVAVPQAVIDAFAESINSSRMDFGTSGNTIVKKIQEEGIVTPGAIADAIKANIASEFGAQESGLEYILTNILFSHNQGMKLDETMMQIKDLMGISGWDLLSKVWKQDYANALLSAYGEDTTREILSHLTSNMEEIDKLVDGTLYDWNAGEPEDVKLPSVDNTAFNKDTGDAAAAAEEMARRIRGAFESLDGLAFNLDLTETSGKMTVTIPQIPTASTGAFVRSGDLVMADENGNFEMMGRMGHQPVIANNQQIVEGISSGVSSANEDVVTELRGLGNLMRQMLNNGLVAKVLPSSTMGRNNNLSAEAYDRVTG